MTMTVPEMAEKLGISRPTAYELVKRSDFPALRIGRRILIPKKSFELWLITSTSNNHDGSVSNLLDGSMKSPE